MISQGRTQSIISLTVWLVITVALGVAFFRAGPEEFAADGNRLARLIFAAIILPGYVVNFALLFWTRRGRQRGDLDERDKAIERRASQGTLATMIVLFYLGCIFLFEKYLVQGTVPVGWLYLLAFGSVALVSLIHPLLSLFLDISGRADG